VFRNGEFGPQFVVLDKGRLLVRKSWLELFERTHLLGFRNFMNTRTGEILGERDDRERMRMELDSPEGKRVFYLKRYQKSSPLRLLWILLGVCSRSHGRQELVNIARMQKAGLFTLTAAAAGEAGRTEGSFVLLEELRGFQPLDDFLAGPCRPRTLSDTRELIRALAQYVRKLHQAGIDHRDLYLCHFFVRPEDPARTLRLIDLQRIKRSWGLRQRHGFIKDLSAMNYSAEQTGVSRADRLRFILAYFGTRHPDFWQRFFLRAVIRKTGKIHRRVLKKQEINGDINQ